MNISIEQQLKVILSKSLDEASKEEIYIALLNFTKKQLQQMERNSGDRKLYYISAEFLVGKLLSNNLINLGIFEEVRDVLKNHGHNLTEIEEMEMEPSLGNGGLGRLAACFLDSIATLGLHGDGVGLNYHDGLFMQKFKDNKQREEKNPWITDESWLTRTDVSFEVPFKDFTLMCRGTTVAVISFICSIWTVWMSQSFTMVSSLIKMISKRISHCSSIRMTAMRRENFCDYISSILW